MKNYFTNMGKQDNVNYTNVTDENDSENTNQENESNHFHKYRGISKCLSDGISFITDNFVTLVRLTSPLTIPFAAIVAILIYNLSINQNNHSTDSLVVNISLVVLALLVISAIESIIFGLLKKKNENIDIRKIKFSELYTSVGNSITKTLSFNLIFFSILIVTYFLSVTLYTFNSESETINLLMIALSVLIKIVVFINIIPLTLSLPWVALENDNFLRSLFNGYKHGMKRWGKLFSLNLITNIITMILSLLMMTPTIVVSMIYHSASASKIIGDKIVIPEGFNIYAFIILFITGLITVVFIWLYLMPSAYMYASIKYDITEEEKNSLPII